jgi:hypothetical protein
MEFKATRLRPRAVNALHDGRGSWPVGILVRDEPDIIAEGYATIFASSIGKGA